MDSLPDLVIRHERIEDHQSKTWDIDKLIFRGGAKINRHASNYKEKLHKLPLKGTKEIELVQKIKSHAEGLIGKGDSTLSVNTYISVICRLYSYIDNKKVSFDSAENVKSTLYEYCEHLFIKTQHGRLKLVGAYASAVILFTFFNDIFEGLVLNINNTRLKKPRQSPRMLSRSAERVLPSDARSVVNFCYELVQSFNLEDLTSGDLPALVKMQDKEVNITPYSGCQNNGETDFTKTHAFMAFNNIVSAQLYIFIAMTMQNCQQAFNLKREKFHYSGSGNNLEVREYKVRRGGEVVFRITKSYKPHFKKYLDFIEKYAPESELLFPYLQKNKGFRKRKCNDIKSVKELFLKHDIPCLPLSTFRSFSENVLIRKTADEDATADYANHAVNTFRNSYELPSLTKATVHLTKFWYKSDPLINGEPKISLFCSHCNGVPKAVENASKYLPKPDCITPTGCINCEHYRDIESFNYVWGLVSIKFLMIIESSSYRTNAVKPSNLVIDWINGKLKWFSDSHVPEHKKWVDESEMRIEEGDYHPSWSRKIQNFEI